MPPSLRHFSDGWSHPMLTPDITFKGRHQYRVLTIVLFVNLTQVNFGSVWCTVVDTCFHIIFPFPGKGLSTRRLHCVTKQWQRGKSSRVRGNQGSGGRSVAHFMIISDTSHSSRANTVEAILTYKRTHTMPCIILSSSSLNRIIWSADSHLP